MFFFLLSATVFTLIPHRISVNLFGFVSPQ